jgi:hypothetical protein
MASASRESASERIALEGLEVRLENLDGGYTVCFESHTADADLATMPVVMRNLAADGASVRQGS